MDKALEELTLKDCNVAKIDHMMFFSNIVHDLFSTRRGNESENSWASKRD